MWFALLVFGTATQIDRCERMTASLAEARSAALKYGGPDVQLETVPPFCRGWTLIDVNLVTNRARTERRIVLRRQRFNYSGEQVTDWTSDKDCPAIRPMLAELNTIELSARSIEFEPWQPGSIPPPPPPEDGVEHILRLRSARQTDKSLSRIEIATTYGSVVNWANRYLPRIESCWTRGPA